MYVFPDVQEFCIFKKPCKISSLMREEDWKCLCFQISILDSKRGMNVGIFLKQFKKYVFHLKTNSISYIFVVYVVSSRSHKTWKPKFAEPNLTSVKMRVVYFCVPKWHFCRHLRMGTRPFSASAVYFWQIKPKLEVNESIAEINLCCGRDYILILDLFPFSYTVSWFCIFCLLKAFSS